MSELSINEILKEIHHLGKRIDRFEERISSRVDQIEEKMTSRMDSVEGKIEKVEEKMDGVEDKMSSRIDQFEEVMSARFNQLEQALYELKEEIADNREDIAYLRERTEEQNKQIWKTQKLYKELSMEVKKLKTSNS